MAKEVWKDVVGYEGLYQVSNFGDVKSVPRNVPHKKKGSQFVPEKILKPALASGYLAVSLFKNNKGKTIGIHRLVWDAYGDSERDSKKLHIDHIDGNKLNNQINNLQLLSPRENLSKARIQEGGKTSEYTGVSWKKEDKRWCASIKVFGQSKNLGSYKTEKEARDNYEYVKQNIVEVCFG